jgi:protein-S-isoprenylcysteine O-methyltransferase
MTMPSSAFLLENGAMYHIANGTALVEYLVTLYFSPSSKSHRYISFIGALRHVVPLAIIFEK